MNTEETNVDVAITNPQETVVTETPDTNPTPDAEPGVDYEKKFSESSKEALRLLEESKKAKAELEARDAEIERLRLLTQQGETNYGGDTDMSSLYQGFDMLPEDEQRNLIEYTKSITNRVSEDLKKDPAYEFARKTYAESTWNNLFDEVTSKYPALKEEKEDFKRKYFRPDKVQDADSMRPLMEDLAKLHLFDKAQDIGAQQAREQQNRMDIERSTGGANATPVAGRSLEDWMQMAQSNPAEFAKKSAEYNADLESGKLK